MTWQCRRSIVAVVIDNDDGLAPRRSITKRPVAPGYAAASAGMENMTLNVKKLSRDNGLSEVEAI